MYVDLDVCVGLKMGFVGVGCLYVCVENLVDPVFVSCFFVGHPGCHPLSSPAWKGRLCTSPEAQQGLSQDGFGCVFSPHPAVSRSGS